MLPVIPRLILQSAVAARDRGGRKRGGERLPHTSVTKFARCVPMKNSASWPTFETPALLRRAATSWTENNKFLMEKGIFVPATNSTNLLLCTDTIFLFILFVPPHDPVPSSFPGSAFNPVRRYRRLGTNDYPERGTLFCETTFERFLGKVWMTFCLRILSRFSPDWEFIVHTL